MHVTESLTLYLFVSYTQCVCYYYYTLSSYIYNVILVQHIVCMFSGWLQVYNDIWLWLNSTCIIHVYPNKVILFFIQTWSGKWTLLFLRGAMLQLLFLLGFSMVLTTKCRYITLRQYTQYTLYYWNHINFMRVYKLIING